MVATGAHRVTPICKSGTASLAESEASKQSNANIWALRIEDDEGTTQWTEWLCDDDKNAGDSLHPVCFQYATIGFVSDQDRASSAWPLSRRRSAWSITVKSTTAASQIRKKASL